VVLIFVFGFLPWSEVSCNSKEIDFRLSQSGYQALYGGVSAPQAVEIMLEEQAEKVHSSPIVSAQELRKKLGVERSYLANVSPFLVSFWARTWHCSALSAAPRWAAGVWGSPCPCAY
jgi:hypothetical protein